MSGKLSPPPSRNSVNLSPIIYYTKCSLNFAWSLPTFRCSRLKIVAEDGGDCSGPVQYETKLMILAYCLAVPGWRSWLRMGGTAPDRCSTRPSLWSLPTGSLFQVEDHDWGWAGLLWTGAVLDQAYDPCLLSRCSRLKIMTEDGADCSGPVQYESKLRIVTEDGNIM